MLIPVAAQRQGTGLDSTEPQRHKDTKKEENERIRPNDCFIQMHQHGMQLDLQLREAQVLPHFSSRFVVGCPEHARPFD